jgi:hypothetical protein
MNAGGGAAVAVTVFVTVVEIDLLESLFPRLPINTRRMNIPAMLPPMMSRRRFAASPAGGELHS